jgi:hypothetical protein
MRPSSAPRLVSLAKAWHNFVRLVSVAACKRQARQPMKIVKLEDFHADGGWDTYSFLKITTDEGITGWIAVGTLITERPPHRSVRAQFGHTAPTLGV